MKQKILYGLLALAISFGLWLYVITVENPASEITFYNIPVVLDNESVLTDRGLMVLDDKTPTVTLKLSGNRSHLNKLTSSNITLVADLSRIYDSGEQAVSYSIAFPGDIPQNSIDILSQLPAQISLTIVERNSKEVPVKVDYIGDAAEGFKPIKDKIVLSHSEIFVAGPASLINEIAEARITIDLTGKNEPIDQSFRYTFYDKNGNPITDGSLTANVPEIKVSLLIQEVKVIPVVYNPISGGGATYRVDGGGNTKITLSVDKIEVAGRGQQFKDLESVSFGDIDLGSTLEDTVLTINLADKLPDGVTVLDGLEQVTLTIDLPELSTKTFTVAQVEAKNLPSGVTVAFEMRPLEVDVRGQEYELKWLQDSQIIAFVDFANAEPVDGKAYEVTFQIDGFKTLGVMTNDHTVTVRVTEEPAA
ncbi:MAG: hypothetical protein E7448_06415 [Ruminococcaceae bacterium]|nr:hypothetical protein [Oscillospiraceae bacterium]